MRRRSLTILEMHPFFPFAGPCFGIIPPNKNKPHRYICQKKKNKQTNKYMFLTCGFYGGSTQSSPRLSASARSSPRGGLAREARTWSANRRLYPRKLRVCQETTVVQKSGNPKMGRPMETWTKICAPCPGGLILTYTQMCFCLPRPTNGFNDPNCSGSRA